MHRNGAVRPVRRDGPDRLRQRGPSPGAHPPATPAGERAARAGGASSRRHDGPLGSRTGRRMVALSCAARRIAESRPAHLDSCEPATRSLIRRSFQPRGPATASQAATDRGPTKSPPSPCFAYVGTRLHVAQASDRRGRDTAYGVIFVATFDPWLLVIPEGSMRGRVAPRRARPRQPDRRRSRERRERTPRAGPAEHTDDSHRRRACVLAEAVRAHAQAGVAYAPTSARPLAAPARPSAPHRCVTRNAVSAERDGELARGPAARTTPAGMGELAPRAHEHRHQEEGLGHREAAARDARGPSTGRPRPSPRAP